MNSKIRDKNVDFLFRAVLALKTIDECYDFFEDLCTAAEIKAMAQRITVAKMLRENKVYTDIVNRTGASTATISRVNRSLHYGCDGYEKIFERIVLDSQGMARLKKTDEPVSKAGRKMKDLPTEDTDEE